MALKATAFDTNGCHWFTSLGSNGGTDWPNSALYWPDGVTAGWSGSLLSRWQKMTTMLGRAPDGLRDYFVLSDVTKTTGVSGSAGSYGFITSDHRAIMNAGAALLASFLLTNGSANQDTFTDVTSGSHDGHLDLMIQNLKRWADDTGNTAPIKKILLGYHHEPSNDSGAGTAWQFKKAFQYIVNYFASKGIGPGKQYDIVEWVYIDIATAFNSGSYYPGDPYCTWVFADPYDWGGGLVTPAADNGHIPTLGDTVTTSSHYADRWRDPVEICQPLLDWADNHPTIRLGLAEMGASGDIDRYTVNGSGVLVNPKVHTGVPGLLTEWVSQIPNAFKGQASAGGVAADNAFTADPRMRRIQILAYWNSQAQGPRWVNQMPVASGGTVPGVGLPAGVTQHDVLDAFKATVADPWFAGTASNPPAVTGFSLTAVDGAVDQAAWSLTVTMGSSAIGDFSIDTGDSTLPAVTGSLTVADGVGTASGVINYSADGGYQATATVTDGNGLTDDEQASVTVTGGSAGSLVRARTKLVRWQGGLTEDVAVFGRQRFNSSDDWVEKLAQRWIPIVLRDDSVNWASFPSTVTSYQNVGNLRWWPADLTAYELIKASVTVNTALAGAKLVPIYSIDNGTTWKCFDAADDATTAGSAVTFGAAGPLTGPVLDAGSVGPHTSGTFHIPLEARIATALVTFAGYGGDGASNVMPNRLSIAVN